MSRSFTPILRVLFGVILGVVLFFFAMINNIPYLLPPSLLLLATLAFFLLIRLPWKGKLKKFLLFILGSLTLYYGTYIGVQRSIYTNTKENAQEAIMRYEATTEDKNEKGEFIAELGKKQDSYIYILSGKGLAESLFLRPFI